MESINSVCSSINGMVGASTFGRMFRLEGSGHVSINYRASVTCMLTHTQANEIKNTRFLTEIRAGLTTFFTMAYIIAVNVRPRH